jgi:NTP pyrophosphatase (non-canonical NTP hydrolase)
MTPIDRARATFELYAAMDAPDVPLDEFSGLQVRLARWQARNFGVASHEQMALGVAEEAGELAHAVLKHSQGIRGMADPEAYREAAGDAIADVAIYAIQLATALRLDFATLLMATAEKVMERDWRANAAG